MAGTKYIFVSGGVISGVGKGTFTSILASLLEDHGYRVAPMKTDMYLNIDAGTIRPQEHGEVFVLNDGLECDQDLGNYERFLGRALSRRNYMTTGQVYYTVIQKERAFGYNGEDVETVPDITDEIIKRIKAAGEGDEGEKNADIVMIELGGTVGEYQNGIFFEAARLMHLSAPDDVIHIHLSYLPVPPSLGEMKTKPVQQSVKLLNSMGINADFVVIRSEEGLDEIRRKKISIYCNVVPEAVISCPDVDNIYKLPNILLDQQLETKVLEKLSLGSNCTKHTRWDDLLNKVEAGNTQAAVRIGVIGKYFKIGAFSLADVYISVIQAIRHAGWFFSRNIDIVWIDGESLETGGTEELDTVSGIIVPGGFGSRGIEGILKAIEFARTKKVPYLGLCYGMQLAAVEFARNVAGIKDAQTTEIDPDTPGPIVHIMPEQEKKLLSKEYGGTMRLGAYPALLKPGTKAHQAYGQDTISERHRHRYEFNSAYREPLEKKGLVISATSPDGKVVEMIELEDHPFFVASQFHPEFKSNPFTPHPLFRDFIRASMGKKE